MNSLSGITLNDDFKGHNLSDCPIIPIIRLIRLFGSLIVLINLANPSQSFASDNCDN